jgi:NAD(P)-dependent dehydrogenase (short-subunit alcohol dehydrogenase family)
LERCFRGFAQARFEQRLGLSSERRPGQVGVLPGRIERDYGKIDIVVANAAFQRWIPLLRGTPARGWSASGRASTISGLAAMLFAMSAACVLAVFARMRHMAVRRVSMMCRLLMISGLVVLRGL